MLPKQPNQSLIDGLACLHALAGRRDPVGVRELARDLALEPTRAHRLLRTLAHLGLAQRSADGKYGVGSGIHVLAAMSLFGSGLMRAALRPLESLGQALGPDLIIALGVLWRDQVAYLYHAPGGTDAADAIGRTGLYPATRSGIGLALLALKDAAAVRLLYADRPIPGYSSPDTLVAELQRIGTRGYAQVTRGEADRTLAIALPDGSAAIAVAGKSSSTETERLVGALRRAADAIHTHQHERTHHA